MVCGTMGYIGYHQETYAVALFSIFAGIAFILFVYQACYLQRMRTLPVILFPVLSVSFCVDNILMALGKGISSHGAAANVGYFFHSLIVPISVIVLYEIPYRLHEVRLIHFFCFPFDQGEDKKHFPAKISLWVMRTIALGLFVLNIIVNYRLEHDVIDEDDLAGRSGFITLAKYPNDGELWLALVPSIFLSILAIIMGYNLYCYGDNMTMSLGKDSTYWLVISFAVILLALGQVAGTFYYSVTSNAGELAMMIGMTRMLVVIQNELTVTASYAEFLHRSNLAFKAALKHPEPKYKDAAKSKYSSVELHLQRKDEDIIAVEIDEKEQEKSPPRGIIHRHVAEQTEKDSTEDQVDITSSTRDMPIFDIESKPSPSRVQWDMSPRSPRNRPTQQDINSSPSFRIELYDGDSPLP